MNTSEELVRLGEQPRLGAYIRDIWRRREFAGSLAAGEMRSENMDSVLGSFWHLLNPLLLVGVYYLVFGIMLPVGRVDNFITFLAIGVFVFHYTQKSVVSGAKSITSNLGLVRSIAFPRAVLPIATVGAQTLSFLPAVAVMLGVALITGEPLRSSWLLLLPLFILQAIFNLGTVLVVARLSDAFYDVQQILPYFFRLLFYVSGILYPVTAFVTDPVKRLVFDLNPMYVFVTLVRAPLLGEYLDPRLVGIGTIWALGVFLLGFPTFKTGEHRYGRG